MADTPPSTVTLQDVVETVKSVWQALVAPAGLAVAGSMWAAYQWLANRKDARRKEVAGLDDSRAKRIEAEAKRQDTAEAALVARLEAEIARKDSELAAARAQHVAEIARLEAKIVFLEKDRDEGWRGTVAGRDGWQACRHNANGIIARLLLLLEANKVTLPEPTPLPMVPDIDTLVGRKA